MDVLADWGPFLSSASAAAALVLVPGLLVAGGFGLRGVALLGTAPLLSVTLIAVAAIVGPLLGLAWGPLPVALLTLAAAGLALGAAWLLRRVGPAPPARDPGRVVLAALGGVATGLVVTAWALLPGWRRPDALSQTYDANFHYNAVRLAVDTGDASSLHLGVLIQPGRESAFYPGGWHALVSLVVQLGDLPIAVATNAVSLVVAGLVWPAGCVLLVRQVLGARWSPLLAAGALCGAFLALPTQILSFGVLLPNTLGYVLVPAALGVALAAWGLARDDTIGWPRGWALLAAGVVGLGLAHPNAVFALVALGLPAAAVAGTRWASRQWRAGRKAVVVTPVVVAAVASVVIAQALAGSDTFGRVSEFDWPARMTVAQATGEFVLLAAVDSPAAWILPALVLVGVLAAWRDSGLRWLVVSYLVAGALYVLAAGSDGRLSSVLTGPWYNDAFRLAAMIPIIGVPLAVMGVVMLATWLSRRVAGRSGAGARTSAVTSSPVLVLVVSALVLVLTGVGYAQLRRDVIAASYALTESHASSPLVTLDELEFFEGMPALVPPGVAVAGNPWTGSALVYAIADRPVAFPHVEGIWDAPRVVVAERLRDVATDPEVCRAARDLGVGFAIEGGDYLWEDDRASTYPGLTDLDGAEGFELVASSGDTRLYRITACAGGVPPS